MSHLRGSFPTCIFGKFSVIITRNKTHKTRVPTAATFRKWIKRLLWMKLEMGINDMMMGQVKLLWIHKFLQCRLLRVLPVRPTNCGCSLVYFWLLLHLSVWLFSLDCVLSCLHSCDILNQWREPQAQCINIHKSLASDDAHFFAYRHHRVDHSGCCSSSHSLSANHWEWVWRWQMMKVKSKHRWPIYLFNHVFSICTAYRMRRPDAFRPSSTSVTT